MNNQKIAQILKTKKQNVRRTSVNVTSMTAGNTTPREQSQEHFKCQSKEQYCKLLKDSNLQNLPKEIADLIQMESPGLQMNSDIASNSSMMQGSLKCQLCSLISQNTNQQEGSNGSLNQRQMQIIMPYVNNKLYIKMLLQKSKKNKKTIKFDVKENSQTISHDNNQIKHQVKPPLPIIKNQKLQSISVSKSRNIQEQDQSVSSLQNLKGPNKILSRLIIKKRNQSQPHLDPIKDTKTQPKFQQDQQTQVERFNFTQSMTPRAKLLMMIKNSSQEYSNFTQSPTLSNREMWRQETEQDDNEAIEPLTIKLGLMDNNDLEGVNPQFSRTFDQRKTPQSVIHQDDYYEQQTFRPFQQQISIISQQEDDQNEEQSHLQSLIISQRRRDSTPHHHISIELENVDQRSDDVDSEEEKDQVLGSNCYSFMSPSSLDHSRVLLSANTSITHQSKTPNIMNFKIKPNFLNNQQKSVSFKQKQYNTIDTSYYSDIQNDTLTSKPERVNPLFPDINPKRGSILETIKKINVSKRFGGDSQIKNQKKTLSLKQIKFSQNHQESINKRLSNLGNN